MKANVHDLIWVVDLVKAQCKGYSSEHGHDYSASLVRLKYSLQRVTVSLKSKHRSVSFRGFKVQVQLTR